MDCTNVFSVRAVQPVVHRFGGTLKSLLGQQAFYRPIDSSLTRVMKPLKNVWLTWMIPSASSVVVEL